MAITRRRFLAALGLIAVCPTLPVLRANTLPMKVRRMDRDDSWFVTYTYGWSYVIEPDGAGGFTGKSAICPIGANAVRLMGGGVSRDECRRLMWNAHQKMGNPVN